MFARTWSVCRFMRRNTTSGLIQRLQPYSTSKKTHYDVLEVPHDATPAEVQEAFLEKSKKFHPDMNKSDPKAQEKFIEVSDAYAVLSKEDSRNDYDDMLEEEELKNREPFKEHEFYGRYSDKIEERVEQERDKWKRYYQSGQSMWRFEAENEQWQGKSQYENDGVDKTPFTPTQLKLMIAFLILLALSINGTGTYQSGKMRAKREAEKAAVHNALKDLENQMKPKPREIPESYLTKN